MLHHKRIYGHIRDSTKGNINNGLVKHNLEINHNLNFQNSLILVYIHNEKRRKIVESRIFSNHYKLRDQFFFSLSPCLVR